MVKFVDDLPRGKQRRYDWGEITKVLRDNPGKWAIIEPFDDKEVTPTSAQATSRNLRSGRFKGIAAGEYDAKTRGTVVYARYLGKGER
jgi:hypothetical protein